MKKTCVAGDDVAGKTFFVHREVGCRYPVQMVQLGVVRKLVLQVAWRVVGAGKLPGPAAGLPVGLPVGRRTLTFCQRSGALVLRWRAH